MTSLEEWSGGVGGSGHTYFVEIGPLLRKVPIFSVKMLSGHNMFSPRPLCLSILVQPNG